MPVSGTRLYALRGRLRARQSSLFFQRFQQKVHAIHKAMNQMNLEETIRSEQMEEWVMWKKYWMFFGMHAKHGDCK